MTLRGTIGLLAVLGVLVAMVRSQIHPIDPPGALMTPLLARGTSVTALEIARAGMTRRFAAHAAGPLTDDAGTSAAGLVDALGSLVPLMVVSENPRDPTEFGLGRDAVRLIVHGTDSVLLDLDVGTRNPAWTGLYVRRHGETAIELVGALLHWELDKLDHTMAAENALTKRHETGEPSPPRPAKEAP